jgi:hypothetical protein
MAEPLSETYRIAAKEWVELDAAADLLEASKSAVLAQMMAALGDMPVSRAEAAVKAGKEWIDYVEKTVAARKAANLAKVKLEWVRMRFQEQMSAEATNRSERRL